MFGQDCKVHSQLELLHESKITCHGAFSTHQIASPPHIKMAMTANYIGISELKLLHDSKMYWHFLKCKVLLKCTMIYSFHECTMIYSFHEKLNF